MSKLREIMNKQLNEALTEIDALEHGAERTKLRIMLIGALANTASIDFKDAPKGKDAIKEDTAKDVEEVVEEETEEAVVDAIEPSAEEEVDTNEAVDLDEATVEVETVDNLVVLNEENQEVDITDAYNSIFYAASDEERQALALQVTEFMCLPAYQMLNGVVVTNNAGEEELLSDTYSKFMLAYYMTPGEDDSTGVEAVNSYVSQFTDGQIETIEEFINNDNIDAFIEWLSN